MWLGSERLAEPHMTLGSIPSTKNKNSKHLYQGIVNTQVLSSR